MTAVGAFADFVIAAVGGFHVVMMGRNRKNYFIVHSLMDFLAPSLHSTAPWPNGGKHLTPQYVQRSDRCMT